MDELNVLRSVIHEQKPVGSASDPQSSNHLQMELVPSSFVLELLRVLRGKFHREPCTPPVTHAPPVDMVSQKLNRCCSYFTPCTI